MTRTVSAALLVCLLAAPSVSRAQAGWFDLQVPGAIPDLASVTGLDVDPAGNTRLTQRLLRRLQHTGANERIRTYLDAFRFLRARWQDVQQRAGEVNLRAASSRRSRQALEAFLEMFGLVLVRDRGAAEYRVVAGSERGRRRSAYGLFLDTIFAGAGWAPDRIRSRLNAGETIAWDIKRFVVALPLSPQHWRALLDGYSDTIDRNGAEFDPDEALDLLLRIIADPDWEPFHSGLVALDPSTLTYVTERPRMLRLFRDHRDAFADYARSLSIVEARVRTPGDELAREAWEELADASVSTPHDFIEGLFRGSSGRLAYFFDTVSRLPAAHQRFVLGSWQDEPARQRGFDSLWRLFERMPSRADERLQHRDPVAVLRAVMVDEPGTPRAPVSRNFWDLVFRDQGLTRRDLEQASASWEYGPAIDAAFVIGLTMDVPAEVAHNRLRSLSFVQRVFGDAGSQDAAEVLAVAREFGDYSQLMLSLERMQLRDPSVYASLLGYARQIRGDWNSGVRHRALSRFQGAIALVEQARLAGALPVTLAGEVLLALVEPARSGSVAEWLEQRFLPALNLSPRVDFEAGSTENELLAALAGARRGPGNPREITTEWEGLDYRFDRGAMQLARLERTREELRSPGLDAALTVRTEVNRLAGIEAADELASVADTLLAVAASFESPDSARPGTSRRNLAYANRLRAEAEVLLESVRRGDVDRRRTEVAANLAEVAETLVSDALRTLVYAVHLASADGLFDADLAARHDFGIDPGADAVQLRTPWTTPAGLATREGWSVQGSLLSLDLGLAHLYLPRVSRVLPTGGLRFLNEPDLKQLTYAVTLFNPAVATEQQVGRIARAIRRGRTRVRDLMVGAGALSEIAREIRLDPVRRYDLERAVQDGDDELEWLFSRNELFWLGLQGEDVSELGGWGAPTTALDGCLCLRVPPPGAVGFRQNTPGQLALRFADLQLALAEEVDRLGLPAAIIRDLLPLATRELLDGAHIGHGNDIDALVQYVNELSASRVEDYVASLVHEGPFFPPGVSEDSGSGP